MKYLLISSGSDTSWPKLVYDLRYIGGPGGVVADKGKAGWFVGFYLQIAPGKCRADSGFPEKQYKVVDTP